jgi:hypothetical protein
LVTSSRAIGLTTNRSAKGCSFIAIFVPPFKISFFIF